MKMQLMIAGRLRTLVLEPDEAGQSFVGTLDGEPVTFSAVETTPGVVSLIWRGRVYGCVGEDGGVTVQGRSYGYRVHDPRLLTTRRKRPDADSGTLLLKATMAGRVVRLLAAVGDSVQAQSGVVVIEAMKMQNELRTPRAGRVVELKIAAGEMVSSGQVLAVLE